MQGIQFGWPQIIRLGMVQAALGAILVLMTSTLNRIMVVELMLPALVPAALVVLHYVVQILRPRLGHSIDSGGRRTPWILGGMSLLAVGAICVSVATMWIVSSPLLGTVLAIAGFAMVGLGVGTAATALLTLMALRVERERRTPAATLMWLMMMGGMALITHLAGGMLEPYSPTRLLAVTVAVCALALIFTLLGLFRLETDPGDPIAMRLPSQEVSFAEALAEVWQEPSARQFTLFLLVSMLACSLQDLILEPFAGSVMGLSPGASTRLSSLQHMGVVLGMLLVAGGQILSRGTALRPWCIAGCVSSAAALLGLAISGQVGLLWPVQANVFLMGIGNGVLTIAIIGHMMRHASEGGASREGLRIGLWGAAQALALALGSLAGALASDLARTLLPSGGAAYGVVFALAGLVFIVSARLAWRLSDVAALRS